MDKIYELVELKDGSVTVVEKNKAIDKWRAEKAHQQKMIKIRRAVSYILTFLGLLMVFVGVSIGDTVENPMPTIGIALQAAWIVLGGCVAIFGFMHGVK